MKTKYILPIAFAFLFFCSCSWERVEPTGLEPVDPPQSRGLMQVEIAENNAQGADKIKTIRFIVFRDLETSPKVEINEFYDEDDFVIETPSAGKAASRVRITLEVRYRPSDGKEKMVVAIVNEPGSLNLDAISSPQDLAGKEFLLADILNSNHTALQADTWMPMSGATWVKKFYATETEAEQEANVVKLFVSRALARVDLYLVNGGTATENITVSSGSKVTLSNTYGKSPLVYHRQGTHTLGHIQTVTPSPTPLEWTSSAVLSVPPRNTALPKAADSVFMCSFYTPERTCIVAEDADKLRVDLSAVLGSEGIKSGGIVLDKARNVKDDVIRTLTAVERNNAYRVTATVGVSGILGIVQDWNIEEINTEF